MIGTGKMISIIEKWTDQQVELVMQSWRLWVWALINIAFVLYVFSKISRYTPVYMMVFMLLVLYIVIQLAHKWHGRRNKRTDEMDNRSRQIVKVLMSKNEILINNKIADENKKVWDVIEKVKYFDLKKHFYEHIWFNIPSVSLALITIFLFCVLGYKFFYNNAITYWEIVLYLWLVNSLESWIRDSINLYKSYIKNYNRVEKLRDTFDTIPEVEWYETWEEFIYQKGDIVFNNISFYYWENKVLEDFSCHMDGGKKIALVWISGWWKSTIIKLIAWYIHPLKWSIWVDKQFLPSTENIVNKKHVSLQSYYKHIWYLTQEPSVFDGTIYENLLYALHYQPTQEQIEYAIQQSQCEFINQFPHWLQTEIGEKGVRLSGGQRQRLAIAKIFLKNPEIVLLDEPTSALDSLSEEAITKALDNLFEWRTVIVIAHRLQTVKKADDIIVIEDGKIIERWTHDHLVAIWGQYAKMLELQSGF